MNEKIQWMHNHIYNFIGEFSKYQDAYLLFILKKNVPYAYPLNWSKMPYPANTGVNRPGTLFSWNPCLQTLTTTLKVVGSIAI
jgi:hypothetical protein